MVDVDAVWSALAHPARRHVMQVLREGPQPTGVLHAALEDHGQSPSRFATQRHLRVLREADLVLVTQRGRERINALNGSALHQATIGWLPGPDRAMATSLDRLRFSAERIDRTRREDPPMTAVNSLHVVQAITIAAPAQRVWSALVDEPSQWWGSPYLLIEDPKPHLSIDARLGGQVQEVAGEHQASWGTISELEPAHLLAWTGAMGMGGATTGKVEYRLARGGEGTRVTVTHDAIGTFGQGAIDSYDYGWADLQARLAMWVQDGTAFGVAGSNTTPAFTFEPTARD
ncbi:SRPBCC domain-containing protein [Pseudactinotalea sp. Z1732]|uniref:SRPBCC domain-containing protein n=1 Tax=Micrococcales TaxID=85006 RepID=UPI003C7C528F